MQWQGYERQWRCAAWKGKELICIGKAPFSIVLQWQRDVWSRKGIATLRKATVKLS
jgi:hypothetical protein